MPNLLSGATVSLDPNEIRVGTTFDQVLAQQIGSRTAVPSLALGIEPNELRLEDGLSMIYGSSISWASPTRPATKEIYPARTFDLLVGDGRGRRLDRSVSTPCSRSARTASRDQRGDRASSTNISNRSATSRAASTTRRKEERLEGGGRPCSRTCPARPTSCRKTFPST